LPYACLASCARLIDADQFTLVFSRCILLG
jgi:hypothetical protein